MREQNLAEMLFAGSEQLGEPRLRPEQVTAMLGYIELLQRWNRAYNLTAVRDPRDMISRHLLDSLAVLPWIPAGRLLDAGAGAGLPGVPLAIARPDVAVTLLDSAGKKIRFLNHVRRELSLRNVESVQARLEDYFPDQPFDAIISRAFARLAVFAGAAHRIAGRAPLLAMKGRHPGAELEELPQWVRIDAVEKLEVPGLQEIRHLVIMSVIA
jgi:16S rRNA (guanine527-N7)-methyltransferase